MVKCYITNCDTTNYYSKEVALFKLPDDGLIRQKWLDVVSNKFRVNNKNVQICEKHFKASCFGPNRRWGNRFRKTLKKDSFPTENLNPEPPKKLGRFEYEGIQSTENQSTDLVDENVNLSVNFQPRNRFQRQMQRNSTKTTIQNEIKSTQITMQESKPQIFPENLGQEINPPILQVLVKSEPESTFLENSNNFDTDIKPCFLQEPHSEHESTFPEGLDDSEVDIKPTIVNIPTSENESIFPDGFDDSKIDIKPNIVHIQKIDNSTQVNFLPNDSNFDIFFCNLNQNGNKCVAETQASFRDYEQINGRKVIVRKVYDWHGKDVRICFE